MDYDALVEQLQKLASDVEAKVGPLALFMLVAPDVDTNDAWNVVVSARGFDTQSRGNSVRLLSELLRNAVEETHWAQIARTTVLRTDDPFVRSMNQAFQTDHRPLKLQSCNVFGFELPKAIVLESKRIAA